MGARAGAAADARDARGAGLERLILDTTVLVAAERATAVARGRIVVTTDAAGFAGLPGVQVRAPR